MMDDRDVDCAKNIIHDLLLMGDATHISNNTGDPCLEIWILFKGAHHALDNLHRLLHRGKLSTGYDIGLGGKRERRRKTATNGISQHIIGDKCRVKFLVMLKLFHELQGQTHTSPSATPPRARPPTFTSE